VALVVVVVVDLWSYTSGPSSRLVVMVVAAFICRGRSSGLVVVLVGHSSGLVVVLVG